MRRRSAAAVSTTTPRSDSSSEILRSSSSDGDSSARAIARSAFVSPRARYGSTGHRTNRLTSVTANVATPHGSRMNEYSNARQPTGSFSPAHSQEKNPSSRRLRAIGLGSSIRTPSMPRARPRSARPRPRAPCSPSTSSGSPITVTESPAPTPIRNTVYTNPAIAIGRLARRYAISFHVHRSKANRAGGGRSLSGREGLMVIRPACRAGASHAMGFVGGAE